MLEKLEHVVTSIPANIVLAAGTVGTWLAGILTPAASAVTIAWVVFQWYHSVPMKEWRAARAERKSDELGKN